MKRETVKQVDHSMQVFHCFVVSCVITWASAQQTPSAASGFSESWNALVEQALF
jgi:hypothetical protein